MKMEKMVTQIKYTGKRGNSEESSALFTMEYDKYSKSGDSSWSCKFTNMSLMDTAKLIVEFFDSTPAANSLTFSILGKEVEIYKSPSEHNYNHYLEEICSQIFIK